MLVEERHAGILTAVRRQGSATVGQLSAQLEVSEATIRRDLVQLAEDGLLVAMVEGVHFRGPDYVGRLRLADGNHVEALLGLQPPAVGSTVRLAWNDPAPVFFD